MRQIVVRHCQKKGFRASVARVPRTEVKKMLCSSAAGLCAAAVRSRGAVAFRRLHVALAARSAFFSASAAAADVQDDADIKDVVVVGAGIVGALLAIRLGAWRRRRSADSSAVPALLFAPNSRCCAAAPVTPAALPSRPPHLLCSAHDLADTRRGGALSSAAAACSAAARRRGAELARLRAVARLAALARVGGRRAAVAAARAVHAHAGVGRAGRGPPHL